MKRIGVFCAASDLLEPTFYEEAYALGVWMGNQRLTLVYGGANSGLMEAVARGVHEGGGHIVGVVPRILEERRRESIYLEIKRLAEWIQETFPRKKRLRKDAGAHAWRIAIQRYLESKEYIRLFRDGSELH